MFTPGKRDLTNGGVLEGDSSNHMGLSENVVSQNPLYNWSVLIITFMHIPPSMAVATSLLRMDMFGGFMSIPFCVCLKIWYPFFLFDDFFGFVPHSQGYFEGTVDPIFSHSHDIAPPSGLQLPKPGSADAEHGPWNGRGEQPSKKNQKLIGKQKLSQLCIYILSNYIIFTQFFWRCWLFNHFGGYSIVGGFTCLFFHHPKLHRSLGAFCAKSHICCKVKPST